MRNNNALLISILLCVYFNTTHASNILQTPSTAQTIDYKNDRPKKNTRWSICAYIGSALFMTIGLCTGAISFYDPCASNMYCQLTGLLSGGSLVTGSILALIKFLTDDYEKITIDEYGSTIRFSEDDESFNAHDDADKNPSPPLTRYAVHLVGGIPVITSTATP